VGARRARQAGCPRSPRESALRWSRRPSWPRG
jgi:hypothetical protein